MDENLFVKKSDKEELGREKWDDALLTKRERKEQGKEIPVAPEVNLSVEDRKNAYKSAYAERLKITGALMPSKYNGGDHSKMKDVKRTLNEINAILGSEIPEDRVDYEVQIKTLGEKYRDLIKACEDYVGDHPGFRWTSTGRTRKRLVKRVQLMAALELDSLNDTAGRDFVFKNRVSGAVIGNIIGRRMALTSDAAASSLTMEREENTISDETKDITAESRLFDAFGEASLVEKVSLTAVKVPTEKAKPIDKETVRFGYKKAGSLHRDEPDPDKTYNELMYDGPTIYYSKEAMSKLAAIKAMSLLAGATALDAKEDIKLIYTSETFGDKKVCFVSGAYLMAKPGMFSAQVNGDGIAASLDEGTLRLLTPELKSAILEMTEEQAKYALGDLLSKEKQAAFISRLNALKNKLSNLPEVENEEEVKVFPDLFDQFSSGYVPAKNEAEIQDQNIYDYKKLYDSINARLLECKTTEKKTEVLASLTGFIKTKLYNKLPENERDMVGHICNRLISENINEEMIKAAILKRQEVSKAIVNAVEGKKNADLPKEIAAKLSNNEKYNLTNTYRTYLALKENEELYLEYKKYTGLINRLDDVKSRQQSPDPGNLFEVSKKLMRKLYPGDDGYDDAMSEVSDAGEYIGYFEKYQKLIDEDLKDESRLIVERSRLKSTELLGDLRSDTLEKKKSELTESIEKSEKDIAERKRIRECRAKAIEECSKIAKEYSEILEEMDKDSWNINVCKRFTDVNEILKKCIKKDGSLVDLDDDTLYKNKKGTEHSGRIQKPKEKDKRKFKLPYEGNLDHQISEAEIDEAMAKDGIKDMPENFKELYRLYVRYDLFYTKFKEYFKVKYDEMMKKVEEINEISGDTTVTDEAIVKKLQSVKRTLDKETDMSEARKLLFDNCELKGREMKEADFKRTEDVTLELMAENYKEAYSKYEKAIAEFEKDPAKFTDEEIQKLSDEVNKNLGIVGACMNYARNGTHVSKAWKKDYIASGRADAFYERMIDENRKWKYKLGHYKDIINNKKRDRDNIGKDLFEQLDKIDDDIRADMAKEDNPSPVFKMLLEEKMQFTRVTENHDAFFKKLEDNTEKIKEQAAKEGRKVQSEFRLEDLSENDYNRLKVSNPCYAQRLFTDYKMRHATRMGIKRYDSATDAIKMDDGDIFDIKRTADGKGASCVIKEKNRTARYRVYPDPRSFSDWGKTDQQSNNHLGYHGTCGPSSGAVIINQLYRMEIATENITVDLMDRMGRCNRNFYNVSDENANPVLDEKTKQPIKTDVISREASGGTNFYAIQTLYKSFNLDYEIEYAREKGTSDELNEKASLKTIGQRLKEGEQVQLGVFSQFLWNTEEPGTYFSDKTHMESMNKFGRTRFKNKQVWVSHWINVCGVYYDEDAAEDAEPAGFLVRDTGGGEFLHIPAEKLKEAYIGGKDYAVQYTAAVFVKPPKLSKEAEEEQRLYEEKCQKEFEEKKAGGIK